jgi:lipoate-protein ligase A
VSGLFIAALQYMGIEASFSAARVGDHRHPDCFATTGEYEIINSSASKLIGSAQTTTRTACLQHGSIPLGKSTYNAADYLEAELPGSGNRPSALPPSDLEEELGRTVSFEEATLLFRGAFGECIPLRDSELSSEEETLSRELAQSKYQDSAWNRAR